MDQTGSTENKVGKNNTAGKLARNQSQEALSQHLEMKISKY